MTEHLSIPMGTLSARNSREVFGGPGGHVTQKQDAGVNEENCMLSKTPTPIYRHAAPSGPWPWMDFEEDLPLVPTPSDQLISPNVESWRGYPQILFPNWTKVQVDRCEMLRACPQGESSVFKVDVRHDGTFDENDQDMATISDEQSVAKFWGLLQGPRENNIRVRSLFIKNMTQEVLQMLGQKYEIEPFFFSSSTNWIPSRYQENVKKRESDHITVILPFIRAIDWKDAGSIPSQEDSQMIDTQSPLFLRSCSKFILQDLLSVHMVRGVQSSTIISCHPKLRGRTADQLHTLINRTGRSVYWSKNFVRAKDPTCLFLCFLWYAMYEWDEVFEILYSHINSLEQLVLNSESIKETRHLHILQAHLLYYRNLLEDFRKSVLFIKETMNPAMQASSVTEAERAESKCIIVKETEYLLSEIERLESQRLMQVLRLKNVIDLAFASVNIDDSRYMQQLTVATVRDSAAMKQIAYLTTVFLPANFMSNVFSMNVVEINPYGGVTLNHYIAAALSLTAFGMWATVALQVDSVFFPRGSPVWRRMGWPVFYAWDVWRWAFHRMFGGKRKTA